MKTIDLNVEGIALGDLLAMASGENVVVRARDGREFIVAEIDGFDREIELVRQNSELMAFLDARSASGQPTVSLDDVKRRLGLD